MAVIELPGAFLHADNDETVIMFMKGKMTKLMVHVAPQIYRKYITATMQGEKKTVHESAKSPLWNVKECLPVL